MQTGIIQNNNVALCLGKIQLLLGVLLLALMCLNSRSFFGWFWSSFLLNFIEQRQLVRIWQYYFGAFRFGRNSVFTEFSHDHAGFLALFNYRLPLSHADLGSYF